MTCRRTATVLAASLMASCGGGSPQKGSEEISTEWQRVQRDYPFIGEHGEFVCDEWTRQTEEGTQVEREYYHLDKINDKLAGRIALDSEARRFIKANGLKKVTTCDEARGFMRRQHEYFESFPSAEPEPSVPADDLPIEEVPDQRVDKVRDGTFFDHLKTVRIRTWNPANGTFGTCSGVLLNKFTILTAAHCFPSSGFYRISVDYGSEFSNDPANGNWCISNNSPSCGTMPTANNFKVYRNSAYTGTGDTRDDMAVIAHWTFNPWSVIGDNTSAYMRLIVNNSLAAGIKYWIQGYGASNNLGDGVGTPRRSKKREDVAWVGDGYWLSYATVGYGHPCKGDSGSSAIDDVDTPWEMSVGVLSNADTIKPNQCPNFGDKFRYAMFNSGNRDMIQSAMIDSESPVCGGFGYNGWEYWRCWWP